MLSKLQIVFKSINKIVVESESNKKALKEIMKELSYLLNSTVIFVNDQYHDIKLNMELKMINKIDINAKINYSNIKDYNCMVFPVNINYKRVGTILIYSKDYNFTEEDVVIVEAVNTILILLIKHSIKEEERELEIAKSAINTLSYSELESVFFVFDEIHGTEGLLIASKVADKAGITRSIIGNGIRKLESAGVIEARSLGMKGTYIKVLNNKVIDEINKIRLL